MNYRIIGCGITGAVIARMLADNGDSVCIYDRRNHIAGNMYDYIDEHGFLVQQYGPHIFHTSNESVYEFVNRFEEWQDFKLVCGAVWSGKYTPSPFNFTTIDTFFPCDKAELIKERIKKAYPMSNTATVIELLEHSDELIREYAKYLFENDYAPYTAKQWGVSPSEIDPSVLKRVPVRLSYETGYFSDKYEMMPTHSFSYFIQNILNHPNIQIELGVEALRHLTIREEQIFWDDKIDDGVIIFTGAIDELFDKRFGSLPYRSLRFEWKYKDVESIQEAPVVAYPQEQGFTRITEFKKLPIQKGSGTSFAVEYPLPYRQDKDLEPYYPVLTDDSQKKYLKYKELANKVSNLVCCGRLGDFKYYNMDQAIAAAMGVARKLIKVTMLNGEYR